MVPVAGRSKFYTFHQRDGYHAI